MFCLCKFSTCLHTLIIKQTLVHKFCTTGLNRKIILSKSYFRLTRVSILCHKIASITCQHNVIHLTLSPFCQLYHFADVSKMICFVLACICSRLFCFFYDRLEVSPLNIAHYCRQFACTPTFHPIIFNSDGLETIKQVLYFVCLHFAEFFRTQKYVKNMALFYA